jgi:surfactin synthase thioesterase subunit
LVLFLHGLGGDRNTWGSIPSLIQSSLDGFNVVTPEYSASLWSPSSIETSAQRVKTEIETDYSDYDPIFIIGYSLGGLIAREVCRQLLITEGDSILNKMPAVITVGTPLEGARIGNWILPQIPFLSRKIGQISTQEAAFEKYKLAILSSGNRKVRRPKQLHIGIEDDGVIKTHIEDHYTIDDSHIAVIPGTHRNFSQNQEDASYVARVILKQIRKQLTTMSRPGVIKFQENSDSNLPDRLIIIACSRQKRDGGKDIFGGPSPSGWISQVALRQRVISKRSFVWSLIRDAKIEDGFERGGNRAHQPANRSLEFGPDLGGTPVTGHNVSYLPAYQRYTGRIYNQISEEAWQAMLEGRNRFRVLIMSGLYGLIEPEEWIQNYDVHLTDTNEDDGQSVSSMWSELFTETLQYYINNAYKGNPVKVFNLLCDQHYVDAIQWHALPKECSVFHLASKNLADVKLLPVAGVILNSLLLEPQWMERLDRTDRNTRCYPVSDFGKPPAGLAGTEVIFDSRYGNTRQNE